MTIKILYDHQIFTQKYGGISRYFCELLREMGNDPEFSLELGVKFSDNAYLRELPLLPVKPVTTFENFCFGLNFRGKGRLYQTLEKFDLVNSLYCNKALSEKLLRENRFDIFHPTYYDPYFYKYLKNKPFVLTIYDMIYELYHTMFNADDPTIMNKRLIAEKADAIIAISEHTKQDIIKLYGIAPEKIKVIYLGNSLDNSEFDHEVKLPEKYVLFIGNRGLYKNFSLFATAMAPLLRQDDSLHIVCGGSNSFSPEEITLFKSLACENRFIHQKIAADRTLVSLYKNAMAFVFPSLYEGFGIPVLESFSCGCPVILSNVSSLPEVAGDAAEYFNPEDESSIMTAVSKVIYDEAKRVEMRKNGLERLKYFSWEKTAAETKNVYESLI